MVTWSQFVEGMMVLDENGPSHRDKPVQIVVSSEMEKRAAADGKPRMLQEQIAKFHKVHEAYREVRDRLQEQLKVCTADSAVMDSEIRKSRNEFIGLSIKSIRRDPKIMKSKYDEILWKIVIYPLVRPVSEAPKVTSTSSLSLALREHIACGHAAYNAFIETALVRFNVKGENLTDLPRACESLADLGYKPDQSSWLRSFLSRCLCCIGDLNRYSYVFDFKSMIPASQYYELAALIWPADGRAVSCLGIVQKDIGEPFSATFYYLLSASKTVKYGHYLKNLQSIQGTVQDLCAAHGVGTGHHEVHEDSRETVRKFSLNVLNIVYSLVLDEEPSAEEMSQNFATTLELLSVTLRHPVPDAGQWRDADFISAEYLHPSLLFRICVMMIQLFHLKKNSDEVGRGNHLNSLCAFLVTMVGKITTYAQQSLQYWLAYTNFNLIPEPDAQTLMGELDKQHAKSENIESGMIKLPFTDKRLLDGPEVHSPTHRRYDDDYLSVEKENDLSILESQNYNGSIPESASLIEDFWEDVAHSHDCSEFDFGIETTDHRSLSSYLRAFSGFNETQVHLTLVHLLYQWIRFDEELWTFCTANFPDIICNYVDIVNYLSVPKFVGAFAKERNLQLVALEEELLLRGTAPLEKWLSSLDWIETYRCHSTSTPMSHMIILNCRFLGIAKDLQKLGLAYLDQSHKWVCAMSRRNLGQQTAPQNTHKLMTAQKLGQAWFAEQAKEQEREFMIRRADLPKYLVLDTSCLLRRMEWVQRLYGSKLFKVVIPSYVLEELDKGKKNKVYRDAIRWLEKTTETKDLDRMEIQKWKDMNKFDVNLESDWSYLSHSERSVRVMVDCAKFFSEEVKRRTDDSPDYGLHIRVLTDLDLQSVYCARVIEQMERLEMPHEIKLMRIHDFMGWLDEGPSYFRRIQEQDDVNRKV